MSRVSSRLAAMGADGLYTLLLSNLVIVGTAGLSLWWWSWRDVVRTMRAAPVHVPPGMTLVVPGMRLENGELPGDYVMRLERVVRLCREDTGQPVLILGGVTGTLPVSEAEKGRDYLLARGLPVEQVKVENTSQNTLENLRNARALLEADGTTDIGIISNRYHLARIRTISGGLGMNPALCAAEDDCGPLLPRLPRLLLEAWYLHWYHTGATWSRLTGSHKSLGRIS